MFKKITFTECIAADDFNAVDCCNSATVAIGNAEVHVASPLPVAGNSRQPYSSLMLPR